MAAKTKQRNPKKVRKDSVGVQVNRAKDMKRVSQTVWCGVGGRVFGSGVAIGWGRGGGATFQGLKLLGELLHLCLGCVALVLSFLAHFSQ